MTPLDHRLWRLSRAATGLCCSFFVVACGADKPTTPPDTGAGGVSQLEVALPEQKSRIAEADAFFAKPLAATGIKEALALADELSQEASPKSKLAAERIRVVAVARALASAPSAPEVEAALGVEDRRAELKKVIAAAEEDRIGGDDGGRVLLAAQALHAMIDEAAAAPDPVALRALQAGDQPEAEAYRVALVARYASAREAAEEGGFEAFAKAIGPFVCKGCGEMAAVEAAVGKPARDGSGLDCASKEAALFCETLMASAARDPIAKLAPNALTIAALELAANAARSGEAPTSLGAAMKGLEPALGAIVLPQPVELSEAATLGDGDAGLGATAPALIVAQVDKSGVRIGVRAVVEPHALVASDAAESLAKAPVVSLETLAEAEPGEDGAVAGLTDRLGSVRVSLGAAEVEGDKAAVALALDPSVDVEIAQKVVGAMIAESATSVRVLRPGTAGAVLPLWLGTVPAELEAALVPAWERSMIVVVGREALDVWAPQGPKEGAVTLGEDAAATLPEGLEQGWRKDELARLRVALQEDRTAAPRELSEEELGALAKAVMVFADKAKAGRVIHVVADEGARVGDVLVVARYLQEVGLEPAPELARVGEIWDGAECRAEGPCAGAVAVALSRREIPSARGLSAKPGGKKEPAEPREPREPKEPKEKPAAPSAQFCNQADIRSNMAKQAGNFRFCYERELQLQKDLQGRLVMNFVIGLTGSVKSVHIASSELANPKVGQCIQKAISKMQFKAPDGGECVVQWPFKFTN